MQVLWKWFPKSELGGLFIQPWQLPVSDTAPEGSAARAIKAETLSGRYPFDRNTFGVQVVEPIHFRVLQVCKILHAVKGRRDSFP